MARFPKVAPIIVVLSVVYALTMLGWRFILGIGPFWGGAWGDRLTNLIGALYYAHDSWRLPLFYVPKLGFPEGVNIIYTDSLPLMALMLKLTYKLSGIWFNYFGLWIFLCFPLLGLFAALAAREAGLKDNAALIGAAVLAIACPAFLLRFMHLALMGHFLIAWAIYLYFRMLNHSSSNGVILQFAIVSAMAVLVQAYFLMMVLPFLAAALAQCVFEKRLRVWRAAIASASVLGTLVVVGLVAGLIGPNSPRATAGGFGYWSMNVLSPFIPPRDHLPEFVSKLVHWDERNLTWDANTGQHEGYNYLGAGVLLLVLINLIASRRYALSMIGRHSFLALLLLGYCLIAVSNRLFVGDWFVLNFQLPRSLEALTSYFRTGGRFFWPVYYVVMLGTVAVTFRRFDGRTASAMVLVSVGLQLADTQLLRDRISAEVARGFPRVLPTEDWRLLLAAHGFFKQYPSFQCGGWARTWPDNNSNMELLWEAAKLDMPTNSAYLGRNNRDCYEEFTEGIKFDVQPEGLYVFGGSFPISSIEGAPSFNTLCREFNRGVVCSHKWDKLPEIAESSTFRPISRAGLALYTPGETVSFASQGRGKDFLAYGWARPEAWGVWSTGRRSELILEIPNIASDATLTVLATAFMEQRTSVRAFDVIVNGRPLGTWTFMRGHLPTNQSISIPRDVLLGASSLRIAFAPRIDDESPMLIDLTDMHPIRLGLEQLTISTKEKSK